MAQTMTRRLTLPDGAAPAGTDGLLHAPSAARNADAILYALLPRLPGAGTVLELASGTGQHVAALAAARPGLRFRPTEPDPLRRATIDARCAALPNVEAADDLDACAPGWGAATAADALLVVNLLHLVSEAESSVLLDEAAQALGPGGMLAIYGPFLRGGMAVSAGDAAFDADLRAQDPAIGYKDAAAVEQVMTVLGMDVERIEMPANNLMLIGRVGARGL